MPGRDLIDWKAVSLTPLGQEAALSVLPLAFKLAREALVRAGHPAGQEDVTELGHDAAVYAAVTFRPGRGAVLTTWTGWAVRKVVRDFLVASKRAGPAGALSLDVAIEAGGHPEAGAGAAEDPAAAAAAVRARRLLARLPRREREAVEAVWLRRMTRRDAGRTLGMRGGTLGGFLHSGMARLRRAALKGAGDGH